MINYFLILALTMILPDSLNPDSKSIQVVIVNQSPSTVYFDCERLKMNKDSIIITDASCTKVPVQYVDIEWHDSYNINPSQYDRVVQINNTIWNRCMAGRMLVRRNIGVLYEIICLEKGQPNLKGDNLTWK